MRQMTTRGGGASEERVTASEAAKRLNAPQRAKTFLRRAAEAHSAGNPDVQHISRLWIAPMSFWEAVELRPSGRPKTTKRATTKRATTATKRKGGAA